jgi:hypothetical protein
MHGDTLSNERVGIMWEKLVLLLVGKSADLLLKPRSPRKKLARAFATLLESMTDCHKAYLAWRGCKQKSAERTLYDEWQSAILRLAVAIQRLRVMLEILDPDLLAALEEYHSSEGFFPSPEAFQASREEGNMVVVLAGKLEGEGLKSRRKRQREDSDDLKADDDAFKAVIAPLRKFMRDKLKLTAEELI